MKTNEWLDLLSNKNTYRAAVVNGGSKLLATLVFCELFLATCIEVLSNSTEGEAKYFYRIREDVDTTLFNEIEQAMARILKDFLSFEKIIDKSSRLLEETGVDVNEVSSTLSVNNSKDEISLYFLLVSGKCLPISPREADPSNASHKECITTSASECPLRPLPYLISTPPRIRDLPFTSL